MEYIVIAICIVLILVAVYILIKNIIRSFKGKCCEGCKSCPSKQSCNHLQEEKKDIDKKN